MLAYFDCSSGISGDMVLGALIDLGVSVDYLNEQIQSMLPDVCIETETVVRHNIRAVRADVRFPHEHQHRHLSDILALLEKSKLSERNKKSVAGIFQLLAEAEAKVHAATVDEVHFHEVGAADSIADITGTVVGLDKLGITEIYASSVPTGTGSVKIAHGTVSVPAPATAELLCGVPIEASGVPFELTTPTGAAVLKYFVKAFSVLPAMTITASGIGAGTRDLPQQANVFRIITGTPMLATTDRHPDLDHQYEDLITEPPVSHPLVKETVWIVETNIDNMSGELIGHCFEQLWTLDVLDVWSVPIQMKKHRPGVMISVMCRKEHVNAVETLLLTETATLGVRHYPIERTVLFREVCQLKTHWGLINVKRSVLPDGTEKIVPEFESVKKLAAEQGFSLREMFQRLRTGG
ncbi:MAG: nickel pincer cofactor biosynthesis protein LarC [Planctomycetaceae bacterium]|nr:nickel pincer cofactor biosynthesis protein LarC [Planctomycetaceae bacterium]